MEANTKPKKAIIYLRVSTTEQAKEGCSLDMQESKCRAYCLSQGYEIMEVIKDEAESAKNLYRPGLQKALTILKNKKADLIVILKLDRLTRSVRDLATILEFIQKIGFGLASVNDFLDTSSATGRLQLNFLISISQWEREIIAERTKETLDHKKTKGEKIGGKRPFGFNVEMDSNGKKILVEDKVEQKTIRWMLELRNSGHSLQDIVQALKKRKTKNVSGIVNWSPWSVSKILRRQGMTSKRKIRNDKGIPKCQVLA